MENNFHEIFSRNHPVKIASERSFCFVFASLFLVIGLYNLIHGNSGLLLITAACILSVVAVLSPALASPLNRGWSKIGHAIGVITTPLFLKFIHITTIVPIGYLMKITGKHPLRLNYAPTAKSYWIDRDPAGPEAETMENQF